MFKCESCGEIVDHWNEQRELCEDCYSDHGKELDTICLKEILKRKGWEWTLKALLK